MIFFVRISVLSICKENKIDNKSKGIKSIYINYNKIFVGEEKRKKGLNKGSMIKTSYKYKSMTKMGPLKIGNHLKEKSLNMVTHLFYYVKYR